MKTVIVAAGLGSRLWRETYSKPKTLLPFGEGTILSTILSNFHEVGIDDFVIVVGFQAEYIKQYMTENDNFGYNVAFINNDGWEKGNGISVMVAEPEVRGEDFILTMSDHILPTEALKRIVNHDSRHNLLLVDPNTSDVFDIDDATKVQLEQSRITGIGKELNRYDGIDCGIFRLNDNYFSSIRKALENDQDSISAAIKILIANNDMEAVFLNEHEKWVDIDTPADYEYSRKLITPNT